MGRCTKSEKDGLQVAVKPSCLQCTFPRRAQIRDEQYPGRISSEGQKNWSDCVANRYLLPAEAAEATVSSSNKTENADVVCSSWEQVKSEARDQQSEDTRRESVAKNDSHSKELSLEKACDCQIEIDELRWRIKDLEERREAEKFGVRRFMASDSDIRFYTGLPDYATFIALYNFAKPKARFSLNYYNGYTNASKDPSYIVSRGRPRNLCELDCVSVCWRKTLATGLTFYSRKYHRYLLPG